MEEPRVLISILNWNTPESTARTVQSVLLSDYDNYKIILLDNNSADNSVSILSNLFPSIKLIKNTTNLGYAGAHKIAAKIAMKENYKLLWILNNDVEVFSDTLKELTQAYDKNGESLLGSITVETDRETIHFGGGLEMLTDYETDKLSGYNIFAGKKLNQIEFLERKVSALQGCSLLIPINIIRKYGFIKTSFFLYGEETEYCYRLRTKYNVQSIIVPKSIVVHNEGQSFKNERLKWLKNYYVIRNSNLVHKKYEKQIAITAMSIKQLPFYCYFFIKHYLFKRKNKKNAEYWLKYYTELGNFHSLLRIKGKYIKPEDFCNIR